MTKTIISIATITFLVIFYQNCGSAFDSMNLSPSPEGGGSTDGTQQENNTPPTNTPESNQNSVVARGGIYFADRLSKIYIPHGAFVTDNDKLARFTEKFNRYYTDPDWKPLRTIYVLPSGSSSIDNNSRNNPTDIAAALQAAQPGDMIFLLAGEYLNFNVKMYSHAPEGTYDQPIVFFGERNIDGSLGVKLFCRETTNSHDGSCFNLEEVDYIAIDGVELIGGKYGVRAVGGYRTLVHQKGIAVLNSEGHNQCADPFFTGESNWFVLENNKAHHSGHCPSGNSDGHGVYLSNGGDWVVVRNNELWSNMSSDFQINSDPMSMCDEGGFPDNESRCDGSALVGHGEGISEFYHIEGNYFHNGDRQGPNLTSVRNSVVVGNIFALYASHGFSLWQESNSTFPAGTNPDLGSSYNLIKRNLFVNDPKTASGGRHIIALTQYATNNEFVENAFVALAISGQQIIPDSTVLVAEVDASSTGSNIFTGNCVLGGNTFDISSSNSWPYTLGTDLSTDVKIDWFENFPLDRMGKASDWNLVNKNIPVNCPNLSFN